ncbi:zinc finger RING-type protein [Fadolivirus algeromassiliense]|jgi:hypothetical protein|uniref:Zinc finger RING-type protein n=1 Tax=Fadolivirus FV1/VV64 TaxID=3070911 RepID=A0A7D3UQI8_9VIRU|nr:zinc finger RING-type protein [Fadolivirus algeromassiliense]QKF93833.1 zinc finger RING-type protein [Fadolivirus FV1/VV64]
MNIQELIYARVKLQNPPIGKRIHISKDCSQIFYYNKREKVYMISNEGISIKNDFEFMKAKIENEGDNGWYKILLDIDVDKLNEILKYPYNINGRKHLFEIFRKCITETKNNYISHLILNLYEQILLNKNTSFDEWFREKEECSNIYTYLNNDMYKLGEYYIDTMNGQFIKDVTLNNCTVNGGVVYDLTYSWVDLMINSISKTHSRNIDITDTVTLIYTKCTIIICNKSMCTYWLSKINTQQPSASVKIINNLKDHKSITYNELIELDYLIISYEYFCTKKFMTTIDDYNINNNKVEDILKIIKNEYVKFDNIKDRSDTILFLIYWNRIIIDSVTFNESLKNKNIYDLIMLFKAGKRWIHLDKMLNSQQDYFNLFKYLLNDTNTVFPLYDNNLNIKYINDLLYVSTNKNNNSIIKEQCVIIRSGLLEKDILKYFENIKCNNIYKFYNTLNNLYESMITRQEYVDILDNLKLNAQFDDLQCSVCLESNDHDKMLFTNCGHHYCVKCILQYLEFNKACPICRKEIDLKDLHYIDDICTNDKANELIRTLKSYGSRTYIYVNNLKHKRYLANYLKTYEVNCEIEWINNDFNKIQKIINSESGNNICIIFYDIFDEIEVIKKQLKLNNFSSIKIYYLIYDILKERFLGNGNTY